MRILVHICCGPCAITVLQYLLEHGHEPTGYFFNPNIHPLAEYMRRREGALQVADRLGVPLIFADQLPPDEQAWDDPWLHDRTGALDNSPYSALQEGPDGPESSPGIGFQQVPETFPLPFAPGKPTVAQAANPVPWFRAISGREGERCAFCWRLRINHSAEAARRLGFTAFTSSLLYSRYQDHERIHALGENAAQNAGISLYYQDFRTFWQQGIALSKEWGIYRQPYCGCLLSEYDRYAKDFALNSVVTS